MKKVVMGSLVLGAVMGGLAVVQMPQHAQAATYQVKKLMGFRQPTSYYAKSAKSGYLWNKSHTKRLHNLKNYPKTTRYATAKYSMKSVRNSGTYLKVTNGTGKAEGYVWTGYLKKGVNPANLNGTLTDPFGAAMSTYNVDDNLNKQLLDLFPGTIPDEPLQLAADFIFANAGANPDDYTSVIEQLVGAENEPSVFRLSSDKRIQKNQNFLSFQRNSLKDKLATKHKSSRVLRDIESVRMLSLSTTNGMECRSFFCCLQIKIANYGNKNMDPNLVKVLRFRSIFLTR